MDLLITFCITDVINKAKICRHEVYEVTFSQSKGKMTAKADMILSLLLGVPFMITMNIDIPLGMSLRISTYPPSLANSTIMEFCGFADDKEVIQADTVSTLLLILVRILSQGIRIHSLPPDVISIENIQFKYSVDNGYSIVLCQLPVTLAYAVTYYKSL